MSRYKKQQTQHKQTTEQHQNKKEDATLQKHTIEATNIREHADVLVSTLQFAGDYGKVLTTKELITIELGEKWHVEGTQLTNEVKATTTVINALLPKKIPTTPLVKGPKKDKAVTKGKGSKAK